ncbi:YbhB/YbcL family Raf kinase inhibitor-like protein [Candidatus Gracilibacteria bacterium]|nr:YbhB/YbcL family Raf kinase inhibitor-like protein [Candidatus Gracilibacteria bacterium]
MSILIIGFGVLLLMLGVIVYVAISKYSLIGNLIVTSKDFLNNGFLDSKFTCDGLNLIPEIEIKNLPVNTKSLAIIIEDPDAPKSTWVHFIAWNIKIESIKDVILFKDNIEEINGLIRGINSANELSWHGPCPPKGHGVHIYYFKVYALNKEKINLKEGSNKEDFLEEIKGIDLSYGELIGKYKRD